MKEASERSPVKVTRSKSIGNKSSLSLLKETAGVPASAVPPPAPAPPKGVSALKKIRFKGGCPRRLTAALYSLTTLVVWLAASYGVAQIILRQQSEGGDEEHEEKEDGEHDAALTPSAHGEGEEHHVSQSSDLQATLGICAMLIVVTVIFEQGKHWLEVKTPPLMRGVLGALFGELTVLGFIALYAFMMLQTGLLSKVSELLFNDGEHLVHLFETVHFLLFFVMILFLVEATVYLQALLKAEGTWMGIETFISSYAWNANAEGKGATAAVASRLSSTYRQAFFSCCNRLCCPRLLWNMRISEAKEELIYAMQRERFVTPPAPGPKEVKLPADFDFSNYLRRRGALAVQHLLHVTMLTWAVVLVFLSCVLEAPVWLPQITGAPVDGFYLLGLTVALWLLCQLIEGHLRHVARQLTPVHPLITTPFEGTDEEAPSARLVWTASRPSYESKHVRKGTNKHQGLLWCGKLGPQALLWAMRVLMLLGAMTLAVVYSWLYFVPSDWMIVLVALLPVFDVVFCAPSRLLPLYVVATSIEQLKDPATARDTVLEMKAEKALKMLRVLDMLQTQARNVQRLAKTPGGKVKRKASRQIAPEQLSELQAAFQCFDKDKSGTIDKNELSAVMESLGTKLTDNQLVVLLLEMDPDGSGSVDFDEFAQVMARDPTEKADPEQTANAIFKLLDADNSGTVKTVELKAGLELVGAGLSDDDLSDVMDLFDANRSGDVDKAEFVQALNTMATFV